MQKVIIIKYAELFLKGKNKGYFEQMFFVNIERALKGYKHTLRRPSGRYIVADFNEAEEENILAALKKVFGAPYAFRRVRNVVVAGRYFRSGKIARARKPARSR